MKSFGRAAALSAIVCACAPAQQAQAPLSGEALVARGQYLVTSIGGCNDCHTPMTAQGPDMTRSLQGADLVFAPTIDMPAWGAHAPALAGGPANYTDAQFESFLSTGVRPDGSQARPPMPQFRLNADDAHAVVAFIKTLPPAPPAENAAP